MEFQEYQKLAPKTAIYPNQGSNFIYPAMALAGEAGEVAGKVSKILRAGQSEVSLEQREKIADELGDVLWFLNQLAVELNLSLDDIAMHNLAKLKSRQERQTIEGDGDNR